MLVPTERDREKGRGGGGTCEFRDEMIVTCCSSLGLISVLMSCLSIASSSFSCSLPGEKKSSSLDYSNIDLSAFPLEEQIKLSQKLEAHLLSGREYR